MNSEPNNTLKKDIKIARIGEDDARRGTDKLLDLKKLIVTHEVMYPNIEKWFEHKVLSGLKTKERIGFVGYLQNTPVVSAIVRRGSSSKFCHLHIEESLRDNKLGEIFFILMAYSVKNIAKNIHFTLPESLWELKKDFFKSFNFEKAIRAKEQYRISENELRCAAPFSKVWQTIGEKIKYISKYYSISGLSLDSSILMSIKSEYAKKIMSGEKTIEIRRRFSEKWNGFHVNIYSSGEDRSVIGEAKIKKVYKAKPEEIWAKFRDNLCATEDDFYEYTKNLEEVFAIELNNVRQYISHIPLTQLSSLTERDLKPPQSYFHLKNNRPWSEAITVAALIQGEVSMPKIINYEEEEKQLSFL